MEFSLLVAFIVKHTLADYFLQFPWMFKEKGEYGAIGGIAHSGLHGLFTFLILFTIFPWLAVLFAILDSVAHYHIDFLKCKFRERFDFKENGSVYWMLHGTDQALHLLTYAIIIRLLPL